MQPDVFYPTVCHVCKMPNSAKLPLRRCSGCRLLSYCGTDHQKLNWLAHKDLCHCVQKLLNQTKKETIFQAIEQFMSINDWSDLRTKAMYHVETTLKRPLLPNERQIFLFPKACSVCFNASFKKLLSCPKCHCVSYCCEEHMSQDMEEHHKVCSFYKQCFELDLYMLNDSFQYPAVDLPIQIKHQKLPKNMQNFIDKFMKTDNNYELIVKSEVLSCVMTLIYAIENWSFKSPDQILTIHIVGAGQFEFSLVETLEIVLHWFPHLRSINIVFIGPESPEFPTELSLCAECSQKREIQLTVKSGMLYHEYTEEEGSSIPNFIALYNCGLHEYEDQIFDTWRKSLPCLLNYKETTLLLTSYNQQEAEKDLNRILKHRNATYTPEVQVRCRENPFRSLRPYRDWERTTNGLFFQNNILSVITTNPHQTMNIL